MNPCQCFEIKRVIICELNRGDGPCLTTGAAASEQDAAPEPLALNSDALTNSLAAKLGGSVTTNTEGN